MYQPALAALHLWTDSATARHSPGRKSEDEAQFCLTRAAVETQRAEEATHPAAQRAHAQMAALYRQRALDAQMNDGDIHDWPGEGGNFLPNYG